MDARGDVVSANRTTRATTTTEQASLHSTEKDLNHSKFNKPINANTPDNNNVRTAIREQYCSMTNQCFANARDLHQENINRLFSHELESNLRKQCEKGESIHQQHHTDIEANRCKEMEEFVLE